MATIDGIGIMVKRESPAFVATGGWEFLGWGTPFGRALPMRCELGSATALDALGHATCATPFGFSNWEVLDVLFAQIRWCGSHSGHVRSTGTR
jgi:hypothetical protein